MAIGRRGVVVGQRKWYSQIIITIVVVVVVVVGDSVRRASTRMAIISLEKPIVATVSLYTYTHK